MRDKKRTQAIYDELGTSYAKLYGEEQREKHDILLREIKLQRSEICLDLGCGTGILMSRVANKLRFVIGVDLSVKMVFAAQKRLRRSLRCAFVRADGEFLPFKQNSFQIIFAVTAVLDYLSIPMTVEEAKRTLSGGGVLIFSIIRKAEDFYLTQTSVERGLRGWEVRKMQVGRDIGWFAKIT